MKEIHFVTRKILKRFEGHAHRHCKHMLFKLCTIFQSGESNDIGEI